MDLNLTPQETEFRNELRDWLRANVPEGWKARQDAEDDMRKRFEFLREWQRKLFAGGWAGISWPAEFGGRGASLMEQVIFNEEMARAISSWNKSSSMKKWLAPPRRLPPTHWDWRWLVPRPSPTGRLPRKNVSCGRF